MDGAESARALEARVQCLAGHRHSSSSSSVGSSNSSGSSGGSRSQAAAGGGEWALVLDASDWKVGIVDTRPS